MELINEKWMALPLKQRMQYLDRARSQVGRDARPGTAAILAVETWAAEQSGSLPDPPVATIPEPISRDGQGTTDPEPGTSTGDGGDDEQEFDQLVKAGVVKMHNGEIDMDCSGAFGGDGPSAVGKTDWETRCHKLFSVSDADLKTYQDDVRAGRIKETARGVVMTCNV